MFMGLPNFYTSLLGTVLVGFLYITGDDGQTKCQFVSHIGLEWHPNRSCQRQVMHIFNVLVLDSAVFCFLAKGRFFGSFSFYRPSH